MASPADRQYRQQRQLSRFRKALDRKHGRGKTYHGGVENPHLMTPAQRSAAIRADMEEFTPVLKALIRTRDNCKRSDRSCQAGRWRLSVGRARPRTRGVRRTSNAPRAGPSDSDPHLDGKPSSRPPLLPNGVAA